jgi:cysteine-rich repeat protein
VLVYNRTTNELERAIQEPYPEVFGYGIRALGSDLLVGGWSGAPGGGNVYRFDPATGDLLQTIANPDETAANFGWSVEVVGSRIVVSAPDSPNACLFVFAQDGTLQQSLPCPSGTSYVFGWTMKAMGDSLVVSAPYGDEGIFIYAPCGNGHLDPGEACDDGNRAAGDGCFDVCQVE